MGANTRRWPELLQLRYMQLRSWYRWQEKRRKNADEHETAHSCPNRSELLMLALNA